MGILNSKYGIIPACDVKNLNELKQLVKNTCEFDFIQGYKIGINLVIIEGAKKTVEQIRDLTSLPIIYDHQKYGNDIPEVSSGLFLDQIKAAGVDSIILFPFAGNETLKATIEGCKRVGLFPIVGGEMTHKGFLESGGGYISDAAPLRIYEDAAKLGVDTFVVPGTKVQQIKYYADRIRKIIPNPTFMFPGIGKGQGGDIAEAFEASLPSKCSAIIGRGIYAAKDINKAVSSLWKTASSVL
ncbi:MAG: orotidine 5'-phosphate decarboxylase [Proteobacteria bacterium]|nr:orotidine 5'-phosphate decarboxylase [Pseudomonadota bacterium]